MTKYLRRTERLIEEYRQQEGQRDAEQVKREIRYSRLPSGDKNALRFFRDKNGLIGVEAPWLMADLFSF